MDTVMLHDEVLHDLRYIQPAIFSHKDGLAACGKLLQVLVLPAFADEVIVQTHFKDSICHTYSIVVIHNEAIHFQELLLLIIGKVCNCFASKKHLSEIAFQRGHILQFAHHRFKKSIALREDCFHCFIHTVLRPGVGKGFEPIRYHLGIDDFANPAHQERIPVRVFPNLLCNGRCVHPGVMIRFILIQHPLDARFREAHIDIKVCRYIPWAIDLVLFFVPNLAPQVFYVRHASENDGLECCIRRIFFTFQIFRSKLRKKIQKNLIICRCINFIDDHDNRLLR